MRLSCVVVRAGEFSYREFSELGGQVSAGTPADFGRFVAAETNEWGKVVRTAGIKAN